MNTTLIKKIEKEIYQLNSTEKMLILKELVNSLNINSSEKVGTSYSKYFGIYKNRNLDFAKETKVLRSEWNRNIYRC